MDKTEQKGYLEMNSMLYFCFGFTQEDTRDNIVKCIIAKAYNDATMQGAFNTLISDDGTMKDKAKAAHTEVLRFMEEILLEFENRNFSCADSFDFWHTETCAAIKEKYVEINDDVIDRFSYGNAQKLLNMTMKYLYMLGKVWCGKNSDIEPLLEKVLSLEDLMHVPIDSFIIDAIWKETEIELPYRNNVNPDRKKKDYRIPSDYVIGWSTWSKIDYQRIQKELQDYIRSIDESPLVWEEKRWIESAKYRKKT